MKPWPCSKAPKSPTSPMCYDSPDRAGLCERWHGMALYTLTHLTSTDWKKTLELYQSHVGGPHNQDFKAFMQRV